MEIIIRKGSLVIIKSISDEYWLTHRVKRRHNGRRQRLSSKSVRYMPIKKLTLIEVLDYIIDYTKRSNKKITLEPIQELTVGIPYITITNEKIKEIISKLKK